MALVVTRFDNETARMIVNKDTTMEAHNQRMGQMLTALVKAGADVNWRAAADQPTPLMLAAMSESPMAVAALLNAGADVKAKMKNSYTALKFAEENGPDSAPIVDLLKKAGATE